MASITSTLLHRCHLRRTFSSPIAGNSPAAQSRFLFSRLTLRMSTESKPAGGGGEVESPPDPLVQYVVLRRDLIDSWPLGSVVTQGCHAAVAVVWAHRADRHVQLYCGEANIDCMRKVTLEVKGADELMSLAARLEDGGIEHKVWIEQPEKIPTCLASKPYPKSAVSSFFRKLKLCK